MLKSSGRISRWKGLILWREVITFSVFTKCAASVLKGGGRLILPKGRLSYDHKRILWSEYLNDNAREWVRHRSNFTAWMLKGSGRISPRKGSDDVMKKRFHILCICWIRRNSAEMQRQAEILPKGWLSYDYKRFLRSDYLVSADSWKARHTLNHEIYIPKGWSHMMIGQAFMLEF